MADRSILRTARDWPVAWVAYRKIFVAGGHANGSASNSIETYDPTIQQWNLVGNLPENSWQMRGYLTEKSMLSQGITVWIIPIKYSLPIFSRTAIYTSARFSVKLLIGSQLPSFWPIWLFPRTNLTGTIVGEFNATDPDGNVITYTLVSGEEIRTIPLHYRFQWHTQDRGDFRL